MEKAVVLYTYGVGAFGLHHPHSGHPEMCPGAPGTEGIVLVMQAPAQDRVVQVTRSMIIIGRTDTQDTLGWSKRNVVYMYNLADGQYPHSY